MIRKDALLSLLTFVVAVAACGTAVVGAGAAADDRAECSGGRYYTGGVLDAGAYTTHCFLPGMPITVPGGWQSVEDSATELKLVPPGSRNTDTPALRFWIDPHASTSCTNAPLPVDLSTPAKAVRWLRGNMNVVVSPPRRTTVGRGIPALTVDLDDAPSAPRCDPACPGPCIDYFLFRAPGAAAEPYGTGRGELVRLSFAQIGPPAHLFVFGVDTPSKRIFARLTEVAAKLVASLRLPARLPSRQGR